jgi:hypothetical protein
MVLTFSPIDSVDIQFSRREIICWSGSLLRPIFFESLRFPPVEPDSCCAGAALEFVK